MAKEAGQTKKIPSVVLLFLDGGASQFETFDPKPDAPKEYRCLFGPTNTSMPGIQFCSLLPKMAKLANQMAIVKSFTHQDGDHGGATHWVKTGYPWPPAFKGKAPVIPQQSPSMGSVIARAKGPINRTTGVPNYVRVLSNHGGYPGDDAVWVGQAYAPFRVGLKGSNNHMLNNMGLKIAPDRLADRRTLLQGFDRLDRTSTRAAWRRRWTSISSRPSTCCSARPRKRSTSRRKTPRPRRSTAKVWGRRC